MADSFFGFNTSLDELEDPCTLEASEDEYDALNDETFGEMVDGDWEQQHEEFSIITENNKHMDIEGTLSNLMIDNDDDLPSSFHNKSGDRQHSPSQGQNAILPSLSSIASLKNVCTVEELERSLRQQQQQMPQNQHSPQMQQAPHQQMKPPLMPFYQPPRFPGGMMGPPQPPMGNQQFGHPPGQPMPFRLPQPPLNHMQQQQPHYGNYNMMPPNNMPGNQPRPPLPPGHIPGMEIPNIFPPMHFNQNNFNNQHPLHQQPNNMNQQPNNMNQQPNNMNRFPINPQQMPPGANKPPFLPPNQQFIHNQQFPMNQHFPPNQQFPLNQKGPHNQQQLPLNQQQPPPNQLSGLNQPRPAPLNQQRGIPNQPIPNQPIPLQNNMNQQNVPIQVVPNKNVNQPPLMNSVNNRPFPNVFNNSNGPNQKSQNDTNNIIQMIQNTHPMLQNNAHSGYMNALANSMMNRGMVLRHPNNVGPGMNNHNMQKMGNDNQRRQGNDIDPYNGLMSSREKQWLLNIQLLQLNTGTPYIDDYYYTVFLERKAKKQKEEVNEAHKVNQENHPFSRQNLSNSKFNQYNNNHGGGRQGEGRERCNSTRSNNENPPPNKDGPRTYVPTQFENSLGKLQCGSVTAPRKIIDMEIIGCESPTGETRSSNVSNPSAGVIGAPRGTRHILLAIETLYRILLRLEDMSEPLAIANALILKEREEKQKALLEQQQKEALDNPDDNEDIPKILAEIENAQKQSTRTSTGGNLSLSGTTNTAPVQTNLLNENKTDLLEKLFAGLLFEDRLSAFMNIRKGKMLVLRIMTQAEPTNTWRAPLGRVWPRLLRTLPFALRRDPGVLNSLADYFQQYLNGTEGWAPVSDICLMLSEGSPSAPQSQRASSVPLRSGTPSLPQRSLMHFIMSTTLGLSLLVALMERASVLPKPFPPAWNNMIKCAGRLVNVAVNVRPPYPISRSLLATYAAAAELPAGIEEALADVLSK